MVNFHSNYGLCTNLIAASKNKIVEVIAYARFQLGAYEEVCQTLGCSACRIWI